MMKQANDFTVQVLKEKCKSWGLTTAGTKAELFNRLMEKDPSGGWTLDVEEPGDGAANEASNRPAAVTPTQYDQREMDLVKRQAELTERELALAQREIAMLRLETQRLNQSADGRSSRMSVMTESNRFKLDIPAIADLLSQFHGNGDSFETWEKQVRLLKTTYELDENEVKILISKRLKGKATEWFYSKPEFLQASFENFLTQMRAMFFHRPSRTALRKRFEERTWKKGESFSEYFHEKMILANRVPVDSDDIVDYLIDGIPDVSLHDQARIQQFDSTSSLRRAFDKVMLRGKIENISKDNDLKKSVKPTEEAGTRKDVRKKRCHSCGAATHLAEDCPTKDKGMKCFECRDYGHIAAQCPKKKTSSKDVCSVTKHIRSKYQKKVLINGLEVTALIDTGSDMTLMRADKYIRLGAPLLQRNEIHFRGIGLSDNKTLGKFFTVIDIDSTQFPIDINVISDDLMHHELLIGTDFLNSVELKIREGEILITKLEKTTRESDSVPEILSVDYDCEVDKVDVSYVTNREYKREIEEIVQAYKPTKTCEVGVKMTIIVRDDQPVYQRARRLSPSERNEVNAHVEEWLRDGIIQPSLSEYASPVVLAKKKDGTTRLCVDYRQVNKKILKDRYPLPLIEDQLDLLQDAKIFTTLDLKNGFFHVSVDESSRKYTSFITPNGQYEFLKVPFGLCNSPTVFQKFINAIFIQLTQKKIVLIYMDDLIIPSADCKEGIERLKMVLEVASQHGLIINWTKCYFLQDSVEYLGHKVENGSIRPSEQKTEAVLRFPQPDTIKQIQSFVGLTSYIRKFIAGYSSIARPLTNLLRANVPFRFGEKEKFAFQELKMTLSRKPVLKLYKLNRETELHTDASMYGYGAILMQRDSDDQLFHPVYYMSGKTSPTEEKYHSYELEVLAIVKALRKFRVYLLGIPFKIVTDCRAFALTMNKKDLCVRVARWVLLLEEFSCTIEHRAGKRMSHVDALSRNPLPYTLAIDESEEGLVVKLKKAQREDNEVKQIIDRAERNSIDDYVVRDDLLFKVLDNDVRLVVPKSMQSQIIRRAHEQGHFSIDKTELLIKRDYWFSGMRAKVEKILNNCIGCILAERKQGKQEGWLHTINKGSLPLDTYHIDHLGPLPSTKKRYRHIFVVIDAFSKFVWFYATKSTSTSEVVERLNKQAVIFGNPRRIISDRGTAFTSREFKEYCERENIEHVLITTGVPRSNGQVERINRTLIPLLTKLAAPKSEQWFKYLETAQQYLNSVPSRSTGFTPFNLLLGTHMRLKGNPHIQELIDSELATIFQNDRDELRILAKENILKIQQENRKDYNKRRKEPKRYNEEDMVAIKRTQLGPGLKLATKYLGPYSVVKCLRNDRYLVRRIGEHEGPLQTSTSADHMKPWIDEAENEL